jgi:hypothetical protein
MIGKLTVKSRDLPMKANDLWRKEMNTQLHRDKPNIIDVVSQAVRLKRSGKYLIGKCPLPGHDDRTPSFTINPDRQTFHCFGCHAHGDVIDFVRTYHGLGFKDTLAYLGITSVRMDRHERARLIAESKRKQQQKEIAKTAWRVYSAALADWMRHYQRLIGLRYDFWWEGDEAEEHLPELLKQARDMDQAEALAELVRFANQARRILFTKEGELYG